MKFFSWGTNKKREVQVEALGPGPVWEMCSKCRYSLDGQPISWSILVEVALWLTLNFHPLFFAAAAAAAAAAATVAADAVVAVAAVVAVSTVPL